MNEIFQLIGLLSIFFGVLALTYVVTKQLAHFKQGSTYHKNMKVIEVLPLNQGQYLYIVKITDKYYVFSGSKEKTTFCFEIEEHELVQTQEEIKIPFSRYLEKLNNSNEQR